MKNHRLSIVLNIFAASHPLTRIRPPERIQRKRAIYDQRCAIVPRSYKQTGSQARPQLLVLRRTTARVDVHCMAKAKKINKAIASG
jgi:hypothetical protein